MASHVIPHHLIKVLAAGGGARSMRTWADERHRTGKHVEQLRQLIEAVASQENADARDARVAAHGLERGKAIFEMRVHRTELEDFNFDIAEPLPWLPK